MLENDPADAPWLPEDPVQLARCSPGSAKPAEDYQELSKLTGGLRFPLCNNDSFDNIFNLIAEDVVRGVNLACAFAPERPPGGETPDFERVIVFYTPGDGSEVRRLARVDDMGACGPTGDYYIADGQIEICPDTCGVIEADDSGALEVHVACEQLCGDGDLDGFEECDDGNMEDGDGCSSTCQDELL